MIEVLTQHIGPDELLVAVKAEFDPGLSVAELAAAINDCEARIRAAVPIAKRIYIEPDISRPAPAGVTSRRRLRPPPCHS